MINITSTTFYIKKQIKVKYNLAKILIFNIWEKYKKNYISYSVFFINFIKVF